MYLLISKPHVKNLKLKTNKLFFYGILLAFSAAFFDLLSKKFVFSVLENLAIRENLENPEIRIFSFFSLVAVWNKGVSFGMFNQLENSKIIFCVVQGGAALALSFWLYYSQNRNFTIALGLIIGGALGNFIDRLQNGAVADFLDFYVGQYHWPAFNLADSFVFIGVAIMLLDDLVMTKKSAKK